MMRELRRAGFAPDCHRVETESDFVNALENLPDLILSDYSMPQFSGLRALELVKQQELDIPFILVSGTLGEEAAVEAIKLGATDYVLKDRMARLGSAVKRALEQKQLREQHKQVEESLRRTEERLQLAIEAAGVGPWDWNLLTNEVYFSPEWKRQIGYSDEELPNRYEEWEKRLHPEDRERIISSLNSFCSNPSAGFSEDYRLQCKDGSYRWIHTRGKLICNEEGTPIRMLGCHIDITERRELEQQFLHSQKMEVVGQLAGGIAHDFNNILSVILIQSELTEAIRDLPSEAWAGLQDIRYAAERASFLTQRLLLFGRRQVSQFRQVNLNDVVAGIANMIRRVIGEDVHLELRFRQKHLMTRADPVTMDQVLLNLAVNARDAMPVGGTLLIETSERSVDESLARHHPEASPGRYACLTVTDSGAGIEPEILPKIFEPFFTTKESNKGTGLGLSTVQAIIKQHRGWIQVDTRPGQGTSFQIYFPLLETVIQESQQDSAPSQPHRGSETILVVEDEEAVRMLTRIVLERHGYQVLEASNGLKALTLWEKQRDQVALLLTDLVMPGGLNGKELANQLQSDQPNLKVIYSSGYRAEVAGEDLELRPGENFIEKPFRPDQLLEAVRRCLNEQVPPA